jgi:hypothetical protein
MSQGSQTPPNPVDRVARRLAFDAPGEHLIVAAMKVILTCPAACVRRIPMGDQMTDQVLAR